jgi:hypothetical protein
MEFNRLTRALLRGRDSRINFRLQFRRMKAGRSEAARATQFIFVAVAKYLVFHDPVGKFSQV